MTTTMQRPRPTAGSDFVELNRRINTARLMGRRPFYYTVRLTLVSLMLVAGWTAFFVGSRASS